MPEVERPEGGGAPDHPQYAMWYARWQAEQAIEREQALRRTQREMAQADWEKVWKTYKARRRDDVVVRGQAALREESMTQIAIIGAGIGGLTLYHALRQRGLSATVYEAAPVLREVGAGLAVPSNALQVLERLGLAADVVQRGSPQECMEIHDVASGLLQRVELAAYVREFGYGLVTMHRAALHDVLAAGVSRDDLFLGKQCVSVQPGNPAAVVSFADGSAIEASIVVGADGIDSAVRRSIFPVRGMRHWGSIAYRGVTSFDLPLHLRHAGQIFWGDGCECGFANIGDGRIFWWCACAPAPATEESSPDKLMAFLQQRVLKFPETMRRIIAAVEPETVLRTEVHDLAPLRTWYRENVVLMGDAAHASTPYIGQGAGQAIEDAYVLAAMLARRPSPEVFAAFQRARKKKVDMIVRLSRLTGHFAHMRHPVARAVRNLLFRSTPAFVNRRQLSQLFRLDWTLDTPA